MPGPPIAAPPADVSIAALDDLRAARRRKRLADIHWIDALYQVYISAIIGIVVVLAASGAVGDGRLDPAGVDHVLADGPAWLGVVVALALAIGLRSGVRGGPLALEAPDVWHVLLAPVPRRAALRSPVLRQLRFATFVAVVAGAIAGQLALRRLGGNPLAWVASGAGFALATLALAYGAALVASARRLPSWLGTLVGGGLLAWAVADVLDAAPMSPTSVLGRLAFWPLEVDLWALVPLAVAVALLTLGVLWLDGVSLEAAERRTALVGQLKFAATLQDLRTVIVLRRQLAMELPRSRPWIRERSAGRFPTWHRGVRGVLRWPLARWGRLLLLGVVAGLALRGVWEGTTPLLVVAGLAFFVAGLDAIEPLAQETDHPGRTEAIPRPVGAIMVRHLPVTAVVMLEVGLVAAATADLVDPSTAAVELAAICLVPAALAGAAGAVVSVVSGAPEPSDSWQLVPPEVQGVRTAFRTAWPPIVATLGTVPIAVARSAYDHGRTPYGYAANVGAFVLVIVAIVAAWVYQREAIHTWWRNAQEMQAQGAGFGAAVESTSERVSASRKPAPRKVKTRLER